MVMQQAFEMIQRHLWRIHKDGRTHDFEMYLAEEIVGTVNDSAALWIMATRSDYETTDLTIAIQERAEFKGQRDQLAAQLATLRAPLASLPTGEPTDAEVEAMARELHAVEWAVRPDGPLPLPLWIDLSWPHRNRLKTLARHVLRRERGLA
jgi:hypothetical protein